MIISASRRTDIPALYADWFINRIRAGWCQVPNPKNYNQVSYVSLRPEDVDAIVFWSKNPAPIVRYLGELDGRGFRYYFQFTVNDYPRVLEPNIPALPQRIETFHEVSNHAGSLRIVWRYDPIVISNQTPVDYHRDKFLKIASSLRGYTRRVMISLVDFYEKTNRRLALLERQGFVFDQKAVNSESIGELLKDLAAISRDNGMDIFTCAEERDFSEAGVPPGRCIDGDLIYRLGTLRINRRKDPAQRAACLCIVSKDIGINDTCIQGCPYCYSTRNLALARRHYSEHNATSPVLWGRARELPETELAKHGYQFPISRLVKMFPNSIP